MQDQDQNAPIDEPEAEAEPPPAPSAADALAEAIIKQRRSDFRPPCRACSPFCSIRRRG